jgi:hypothetical protein
MDGTPEGSMDGTLDGSKEGAADSDGANEGSGDKVSGTSKFVVSDERNSPPFTFTGSLPHMTV